MAVIDVTMDTAGVERGAFQLSDQLDQISDRIKELTSVQNTYNASGVQVGAVVRGITKDGKEFVATLGAMTKAERELADAGQDIALGLKSIKYKDKAQEAEELGKSSSKLRDILSDLGNSFKNLATYRTFGFIVDGIKEGVAEANKLQIEISKIRTITQGADQQTNTKFTEDVRRVSDNTGVDVNEIAKAFYDTTSNQVARGKDVAAFTQTAAELARVTGSSTVDTVNLLSSRINAFGLSAKDANQIAAEFFRTIDEGRVVASELANTLGRTDILGSNLGIDRQDLNSIIAITTQKGFKTSDAQTLLTNFLIKLEKPTEATAKFFESIGASSGEAAIKISGGLLPLLRQIVEQTKSGILPVSAFFDEIRGRKQFGVLEQSLDEVEVFSNKLKDVKTTLNTYENAVAIRGESPADKINKEFNKLKNVFKVDIGQEILKLTADFLEFAGGADKVTQNAKILTEVLKVAGITFVTLGGITVAITAYNYAAATSFTALGVAARTAFTVMLPLLAAYAAFVAARSALKAFEVGNTKAFNVVDIDPKDLRATADEMARLKKEAADFFKSTAEKKADPFAGFEESAKKIGTAYKELQGIIAKSITIVDSQLDSTKAKSKEVGDALKVSFNTFADSLRSRVSDFKKVISESNQEIEKSKKAVLGFKDTLDQILFQTKLKFANDSDAFGNQKQAVIQEQIGSLRKRGTELFESGTPEGADQGRRLFAEAAKLQSDLKDLRVERDKARLEAQGGGVLLVDTNDLLRDQLALKKQLDDLELKYQEKQKKRGADFKIGAEEENKRLDRLTQAFDKFNKLSITQKDGSISPEFRDEKTGKFDRAKLEAAISKDENAVRASVGGTFEQRIQLEKEFLARRQALFKEADLLQTSDELKTEQTKNLTKEEEFKKSFEKIKQQRQKLLEQQDSQFNLIDQFPKTLAAFIDKFGKSGTISAQSKEFKEIIELYKQASAASSAAENNKLDVGGGIFAYDPKRLDDAERANKRVIDKILEVQNSIQPNFAQRNAPKVFGAGGPPSLAVTDDQGQEVTLGGARSAFQSTVEKLKKTTFELSQNNAKEGELKNQFEKEVAEPLKNLQRLFPELSKSSQDFTGNLNKGLKENQNSLDGLIQKLERVEQLMKNAAQSKISANLSDTVGEAYAATGGIAGLFPGQPRGLDMYPIWAAKGEYIINSRSAAMYKPMLEAIQSRRMPQYMAAGGRVGGDTNVGDINVTVNGGRTEAQTVRNIGQGIERGIRRGTIQLQPRRTT